MRVKDYMKKNVISVPATMTIREAAAVVVQNHVGTLPVVDERGRPIGVVRLSDLLSLELPDFIHLVADFDFVGDFGAVETTRPAPELLARPITAVMQPVVTIGEDGGLLRAYALMLKNNLYDLPVTAANGALAGIVSIVDIGAAVLSLWREG